MAKLLLAMSVSLLMLTTLAACSVTTSGHVRTEVGTGSR
jgi:hypothetical protein